MNDCNSINKAGWKYLPSTSLYPVLAVLLLVCTQYWQFFYKSVPSNGSINHDIIRAILLGPIIIHLENVSLGGGSLWQHGINWIHTDVLLLVLTSRGVVNIHKQNIGSEGQDLGNWSRNESRAAARIGSTALVLTCEQCPVLEFFAISFKYRTSDCSSVVQRMPKRNKTWGSVSGMERKSNKGQWANKELTGRVWFSVSLI